MMNVVNSGNRFQIYGEDIKTYKKLPVNTYTVCFQKMIGFYLAVCANLNANEEKIYGSIESKVEKTVQSYRLVNRNFGVLLSGQKGIGKSLFVRLLAQKGISLGYPVVVVNDAIPGIADFISSIEQDCIVIFDEFEKTFKAREDWNPQDDMLSLFDGIDGGHKLFVVTCNEINKISEYMVNRPGRFHYHFTIAAPTSNEVREYLQDKVRAEYQTNIEDIVTLSDVIDLPYDYLRAIAFELNQGYSIKEVMSDLNITRVNRITFDLKLYLSNGLIYQCWNESLNLNSKNAWVSLRCLDQTKDYPSNLNIEFDPSTAHLVGNEYIINERIELPHWDEDDFDLPEEEGKRKAEEMNKVKIERLVLKKVPDFGPARYLV